MAAHLGSSYSLVARDAYAVACNLGTSPGSTSVAHENALLCNRGRRCGERWQRFAAQRLIRKGVAGVVAAGNFGSGASQLASMPPDAGKLQCSLLALPRSLKFWPYAEARPSGLMPTCCTVLDVIVVKHIDKHILGRVLQQRRGM